MEPKIDVALKEIKRLQEENMALSIENGILSDVIDERDEEIRALKGQLAILRSDRRYEVG